MVADQDSQRKLHETFNDCLQAKDAAISYFRDTGEGYCHLCRSWHENAVEKERHARGGRHGEN